MRDPLALERRMCACGETFDAFPLWGPDAVCRTCARRRYIERMERLNAGRPYLLRTIGGACPTQAEGETADGREFYFRARHGKWSLQVAAAPGQDAIEDGPVVAAGDDPSGGFMTDEDVMSILDAALGGS